MRTEARFPGRRPRRRPLRELLHQGHAARRRAGRSGSATRSTSAPAPSPTASLWFTLFDAEADGPRATKVTVPADRAVGARPAPTSRSPTRCSSPGRRSGAIAHRRARAPSWDLDLRRTTPTPFHHLPYDVPLPRPAAEDEVPLAPTPTPASAARLTVDGERPRARRAGRG